MKLGIPLVMLLSLTVKIACAEPAPQPSLAPGIFGVGFTNVTGTSARLVFSTSEPMSAGVVVTSSDGTELCRVDLPGRDEIHSANLVNLLPGETCKVAISGTTQAGKTVNADAQSLKPVLRPASTHRWPGYTIFCSTLNGGDEVAMNQMAESGIRMFRIEVSWYDLFRHGREMDRAYMGNILHQVAELKKRNIEPLVVLDYCVPWAKPYTNSTMTWRHAAFGPPDNLEDWAFYLRAVITELRGSAKYYEIWNEPDAGYLATGRYVERPDLPPPIGRAPFKDNWHYWLGDRYVPMIAKVREIMDELEPGAILMNGGWNRDYAGQRGDLLFERGVAPFLDVYAFHCYSASPLSFSRWFGAIDGGFRRNIDRIFEKHHVSMPIAVTEWGWPAWSAPKPDKGFVTFKDAQKFYIKSTFYFLSLQRVEILAQFCFGLGPGGERAKDPDMFSLADRGPDGGVVLQPDYQTFRWLASTFGSRKYRALPVKTEPGSLVNAYAIQLEDSGDVFVATWQDGEPDQQGAIAGRPAREIEASIAELPEGSYALQTLDLNGVPASQSEIAARHNGLHLKITLPEISSSEESGISLLKISGIKSR